MREYFRSIYFTETPLKKKYRYKDIFQIIPLDSKIAPSSPYARHFPLFLEYFIELPDDDFRRINADIIDKITIKSSLEREILELLTSFTNHRFIRYENSDFWGIVSPAIRFEKLEEKAYELYNNQYSSWVS